MVAVADVDTCMSCRRAASKVAADNSTSSVEHSSGYHHKQRLMRRWPAAAEVDWWRGRVATKTGGFSLLENATRMNKTENTSVPDISDQPRRPGCKARPACRSDASTRSRQLL